MKIPLSSDLKKRIRERTVNGQGGFQDLVRKIQAEAEATGALDLDGETRRRVEHYAFDFGSGGWQTLLRDVVAELEQAEQKQP